MMNRAAINERKLIHIDLQFQLDNEVQSKLFFWYDLFEDQSSVYMFGEMPVIRTSDASTTTTRDQRFTFVRACVVKNLLKHVYILPNRNKRHRTKVELGHEQKLLPVDIDIVSQDLADIMDNMKLSNYSINVVHKHFVFDKKLASKDDGIPVVSEYLLIDYHIDGHNWRDITNDKRREDQLSWFNYKEYQVSNYRGSVYIYNLNVDTSFIPLPQTPLTLHTILLRTILNQSRTLLNHQKSQTLVFAVRLIMKKFYLEKATTSVAFQKQPVLYSIIFCALSKPPKAILPYDLSSALKSYQSKFQVNEYGTERASILFFFLKIQSLGVYVLADLDLFDFSLEILLNRCNMLKIPQWSHLGRLKRQKPHLSHQTTCAQESITIKNLRPKNQLAVEDIEKYFDTCIIVPSIVPSIAPSSDEKIRILPLEISKLIGTRRQAKQLGNDKNIRASGSALLESGSSLEAQTSLSWIFIEKYWKRTLSSVKNSYNLSWYRFMFKARFSLFKWCERAVDSPRHHSLLIHDWQKFFNIDLDKLYNPTIQSINRFSSTAAVFQPNCRSSNFDLVFKHKETRNENSNLKKASSNCSSIQKTRIFPLLPTSQYDLLLKQPELTSQLLVNYLYQLTLSYNGSTQQSSSELIANYHFNELMSKHMLSLWINETRLHHPNLYLPVPPSQYELNISYESSVRNLENIFMSEQMPRLELAELETHGVEWLREKRLVPWRSICAIAVLGSLEIVTSGILISSGFGASVGMSLLSEGTSDLLYSYRAYSSRHFGWKDYAKQKAISLFISLYSLGYTKLKDAGKGLFNIASGEANMLTKEAAKEATNFVTTQLSNANELIKTGKNLKSLAIKFIRVKVGEAILREGINSAVQHLINIFLYSFKPRIYLEIQKKVKAKFSDVKLNLLLRKMYATDAFVG